MLIKTNTLILFLATALLLGIISCKKDTLLKLEPVGSLKVQLKADGLLNSNSSKKSNKASATSAISKSSSMADGFKVTITIKGADVPEHSIEADASLQGDFYQLSGPVEVPYNKPFTIKVSTIGVDNCPWSGLSSELLLQEDMPPYVVTISILPETVIDIDGNIYKTVAIGDQLWLQSNLKTTRYRNGDAIPKFTDATEWISIDGISHYTRTTGAYCNYENNDANADISGHLYNWFAVNDSREVCPTGWHVPTETEIRTLVDYLGGTSVAGGKLKESGTLHWQSPNTGADNSSGFTAIPGGARGWYGSFWNNVSDGSDVAIFWSSTSIFTIDAFAMGCFGNSAEVTFQSAPGEVPTLQNGYSIRCIRGENTVPILFTKDITGVTLTSANTGGNIQNNGGLPITASGVCWSTSPNPTIADSKTSDSPSTGEFSSSITGLTSNTTYYVRAYATNSEGTGYGTERVLKTFTGTVTDIDNNTYYTVTIGTQVWMAENLKTTKYNTSVSITNETNNANWSGLTSEAYCWYNNDINNKNIYGALYNYYAVVNADGLCPTGWHIPTTAEWATLISYLGGNTVAGGKLKATHTWNSPNVGADNSSGFTAIPSGYRDDDTVIGGFQDINNVFKWWSATGFDATQAWFGIIPVNSADFFTDGNQMKNGYSVRCVKD